MSEQGKCWFHWSKIIGYIRELSVVMIGILATLTITNLVSDAARQKEIRESFMLVRMELQTNLDQINRVENFHKGQMRFFRLLQEHLNDITAIPQDTMFRYNPIGLINPFRPVSDAYGVFKVSGLMQYVKDRTLLTDLMQTYSAIDGVQEGLSIYDQHHTNAVQGIDEGKDFDSIFAIYQAFDEGNLYPQYKMALENDKFKLFIYGAEGIGIVGQNIQIARESIQEMINEIDRQYRK